MSHDVEQLLPPGLALSASRRRLLEAAVLLFGRLGYAGVSVRDLADQLGIKAASVYAHVASKQDLLLEVVRVGLIEHAQRLQAAHIEASPGAQLAGLVRAHVGMTLDHPSLVRVFTHELKHLDEARLPEVLAIRDRPARLFLDVVERGRSAGEFDVQNPQRALRAIADMGFRAAEWPRPQGTREEIVRDYAAYALLVMRHK